MTAEQLNLAGQIIVAFSVATAILAPSLGRVMTWVLVAGFITLVAGGWGEMERVALRFLVAFGGAAVVSWQAREAYRLAQPHRRRRK